MRRLLLAGVATLLLAPPASVSAQEGGSLGIAVVDQPLTADPRSERYIVGTVEPGQTLRRTVEVANSTAASTGVDLYPGAAEQDGEQFVYAQARGTNELTAWTRVAPQELVLQPGQARTAVVEVAVPATAPAGERSAVLWAEVTTSPGPAGVQLVSRVGVRMHITVRNGGTGLPVVPVAAAGVLVLLAGAAATRLSRRESR